MNKFKVGDKVRIILGGYVEPQYMKYIGMETTIRSIREKNYLLNIFIKEENGVKYFIEAKEYMLEPIIKPPLGSWKQIAKITNWNPLKEEITC